jgi:hypothetical protein
MTATSKTEEPPRAHWSHRSPRGARRQARPGPTSYPPLDLLQAGPTTYGPASSAGPAPCAEVSRVPYRRAKVPVRSGPSALRRWPSVP